MKKEQKARTRTVVVNWDSKKMDELKDRIADFINLPHDQQLSGSQPIRRTP